MAYVDKKIFLNELISLDGVRVSSHLTSLNMGATRGTAPVSAIEDADAMLVKTDWQGTLTGKGMSLAALFEWMKALAELDRAVPLIRFPTADTRLATPVAPGALAILGAAAVNMIGGDDDRGAARAWDLTASPQTRWYLGKVAYSNVKLAAITTGGNSGTGVVLGALGAGQELAIGVAAVEPPGIVGAGTLTPRIESDADPAFLSPVTRWTGTPFGVEPFGQFVVLDGDDPANQTAPDNRWRLAWSTTGAGIGYTLMAAFALVAKPGL